MDFSGEINKYLTWSLTNTSFLFEKNCVVLKNNNSVAALDLPIFKTAKEYDEFVKMAYKSGYQNFNIGLTPVWLGKNPLKVTAIKKMPIISAHGTSIKKALATGKPYQELVFEDLKILDLVDREKKWLVNYDLYAGHLNDLKFNADFRSTLARSAKLLAGRLNLSNEKEAYDLLIIKKIIQDIAFVYKNTGRKICFELPGTKGWSMFPSPSIYYFNFIILQIKKYIPTATICLDLAHILTWDLNERETMKMIRMFIKHEKLISMLHISSAGSNHSSFVKAYKFLYKRKYPNWHIVSLDLALPVYEQKMLDLLSMLRLKIKGRVIEVSENRLPSATINDYFPPLNKIKFDKKLYYRGIWEQGKILGYR